MHVRLHQWLQDSALPHVSYHVRNEDGTTLAEHGSTLARRGASTTKLLTVAAALRVLGPDHRFGLELLCDGDLLYLRGCHPWVQVPELVAFTADLRRHSPRLVLDDSRYPQFHLPDGWSPESLPLNVQPVTPINPREYFGYDPAGAVAESVAGLLTARGRPTRWQGRTIATGDVVAQVESPRLLDLAVECLQSSHNVMAEILGRETAMALGLPPTFESMQAAVVDGLDVDTTGMLLRDACGLSAHDRIRADVLTHVLQGWLVRRGLIEVALPLAGLTGTMSAVNDWFQSTPAADIRGYVMAKSGTLADCVGLAGYTFAPGHPRRVFAILVEGLPGPSPHLATRRQVEAFVHLVATQ